MKLRRQFLFARNGPSERRRSCVIQARRRPLPSGDWIGAGFTATKKVGNAVTRNRAKRRLREASRAHLPGLGVVGTDYVFIARGTTGAENWQRLLDDVESALLSLKKRLGDASSDG
ncbi:MAG: ribonuclease P protein component [Pseudomonadota bacterium]